MKIMTKNPDGTITYTYSNADERNEHINSGEMKGYVLIKAWGGLNNTPVQATFRKDEN